MDFFSNTFTNSMDLKILLDLAAKKWNLITEDKIEVDSSLIITPNGLIMEKDTGMLVPVQKITCKVKPNDQEIDQITLIHNSEKRTISCQAYKNKKNLNPYHYFITADDNNDEIKKFTQVFINI